MFVNHLANSAFSILLCFGFIASIVGPAKAQQATNSKATDPFIGTWQLNVPRSKISPAHRDEQYKSYKRTYEADRDKIKVSWDMDLGKEHPNTGSYSAKCDGTRETANGNDKIQCHYVKPDVIEGEVIGDDSLHRYYKRELSADGKIMTLTWFADSMRKEPADILVFDRVSKKD
jgi:hypothetical protein